MGCTNNALSPFSAINSPKNILKVGGHLSINHWFLIAHKVDRTHHYVCFVCVLLNILPLDKKEQLLKQNGLSLQPTMAHLAAILRGGLGGKQRGNKSPFLPLQAVFTCVQNAQPQIY